MAIIDSHSYFGGSLIPGAAATPAAIMSAMEARGITAAVLQSAHARNVDPLAGNRILRKILESGPNLYGCLVTHTNRADASLTVMREQMTFRKFVAMAMVPSRPGEPLRKLAADELLNAYRRYGKPLFIHTNSGAAVESALEIAKAFTMIKVVFLGMGGEDWRTAIAAAHTATNVVLESSGPLDRAKLPAAVEVLGAHRILFGSGAPNVDAVAALGLVQESGLSEEAQRRILFDNAQRLFGLDAAD